MKKIMFNDRYGLTQAVIEGRKTMTRRLINLNSTSDVQVRIFAGYVQIIGRSGNVCVEKKLSYKVGEIVAVAQRYEDVEELSYLLRDPFSETYFEEVNIGDEPGYRNKMFVKSELMPHQIRITGIRCERLQDISDEDCLLEGVMEHPYIGYVVDGIFYEGHKDYEYNEAMIIFQTPREAFASLIDKVSGRGTWERNPWVVAYEFELVK
nr:MAG TPA: ASCH domain protein [Caudoviricetes sp.]